MDKLRKFVQGMIIMLGFQFLFGMAFNLWGVLPKEETATEKSPAFAQMALAAHGLLALGILTVSLLILGIAFNGKKEDVKKFSILGFISILVAFGGGVMTLIINPEQAQIASFIMSLGFLSSFISYGRLFYILKK